MHLVLRLFLVTSWILIPVFGQLETIGLTTSGVTPTSTLLSTANPTSSLSSPPTSATPSLTTTSPSVTNSGDSLVLTTVFTQPPGCAGGMTEIPAWSTELWQNIVNPVSTMTLSSCYPSQFYYSAIATRILPPYKQLVCPEDWETYNVTDTYIICCPRYAFFSLASTLHLAPERLTGHPLKATMECTCQTTRIRRDLD